MTFGILAPPPLGMIVFLAPLVLSEGAEIVPALSYLIPLAYIVMGLQSVSYAAAMEFIVGRYWPPVTLAKALRFLAVSVMLGAVAGLSGDCLHPGIRGKGVYPLTRAGCLVGAICGVCLVLMRERAHRSKGEQPRPPVAENWPRPLHVALLVGVPASVVLAAVLAISARFPGRINFLLYRDTYEGIIEEVREVGLHPGESVRLTYDYNTTPPSLRRETEADDRNFTFAWAEMTLRGNLKVAFVTVDLHHAGRWGYAYSEVPVYPSREWAGSDVPGPTRWVRKRLNERWWTVDANY